MILEQHPEIMRLSASEKLILVGEIWDDLAAHPSGVPVSREIMEELDRRAEEYRQNPDGVMIWEETKARILSSRKR